MDDDELMQINDSAFPARGLTFLNEPAQECTYFIDIEGVYVCLVENLVPISLI